MPSSSSIRFFYEDVSFKLDHPQKTIDWLTNIVQQEFSEISFINYIFCSDQYLLEINKSRLGHDYYTDIITFDQSDTSAIEADIFISIERVIENAADEKVNLNHEIRRVMIHGVLHLLDFADKTKIQKSEMRKKEDSCLSLYRFKSQ